jgi:hypothetical protein
MKHASPEAVTTWSRRNVQGWCGKVDGARAAPEAGPPSTLATVQLRAGLLFTLNQLCATLCLEPVKEKVRRKKPPKS